jgi:hypothetical protein
MKRSIRAEILRIYRKTSSTKQLHVKTKNEFSRLMLESWASYSRLSDEEIIQRIKETRNGLDTDRLE